MILIMGTLFRVPRSFRSFRSVPAALATFAALAALAVSGVGLTACGSESAGGGDGMQIQAAFYPVAYVARAVGGDLVTVDEITPAGAEPHDIDLKPRDVGRLADADLVVYLAGFQPAVDDAVDDAGATAFDVGDAAVLDLEMGAGDGHDHPGDDEHGHGDGIADPHFWLDPTKLAAVGVALGEELAELDPDNATAYRANARTLERQLTDLDGEMAAGLDDCEEVEMVTSHTAFGYLAHRYGLHQVGIAGLSPNREPSSAGLAEVVDFIDEHGVSTVYFETLSSSDLADALAAETGATTAVLDPLEGISDDSPGTDYPSIMRANLEALRSGQRCA